MARLFIIKQKEKKNLKLEKKSYNPFKMWGSWVGAFLSFLLIYHSIIREIFWYEGFSKCIETFNLDISTIYRSWDFGGVYSLVFITIIGFLIGWGIHSLIRRWI